MGGADGVAAHLLHCLYLTDESSLVLGGSKRTEVVVETYSLYLARHSIELESAFLRHTDGAYAEACDFFVKHFLLAFLG